jgi:aldehyde dehydrogenase (NAD+)
MVENYEQRILVDGELVDGVAGKWYDNINPADGSVIDRAVDAQPEDMERAIGAARRAFDETDWSRDPAFRKHCLLQLQDRLRQRYGTFRDLHIDEAGQVFTTASLVAGLIENMSFMIELGGSYEYERSHGTSDVAGGAVHERRVHKEPFGVAGLISPWNAPFLTNLWKLTPALAAGNTVVLKAAPATPFSATTIGAAVTETDIPAGVVNVISSADKAAVGETLTGDRRVDLYHFTGSPATGARIMERAANGLRKVALELGGKSANILLDDADLDTAVPYSAAMACVLSGQGCALPTRLLAPPNLYAEVVERLRAAFEAFPIGDPRDPRTVIGPIINSSQQQRILNLIESGLSEGAQLVAGGKVPKLDPPLDAGTWVEPTLFVDVDPTSTIAQTEIFGPVLCVIPYRDEDDAARIANATPYGLAGFVQSRDVERALAVARRVRAGSLGVNGTATWVHPDIPFGGFGISGLGREHGVEGFEEYLQSKAITYAV